LLILVFVNEFVSALQKGRKATDTFSAGMGCLVASAAVRKGVSPLADQQDCRAAVVRRFCQLPENEIIED
jgi:hypothetical protein